MTAIIVVLAIALGVPDDVFGEGVHFGARVRRAVRRRRRDLHRAGSAWRPGMAQYRAEVQYAVASTLQQHSALVDAAPRLLREIGEPLGFVVGGLWEVLPDRTLRCVETWRAPGVDAEEFEEVTRDLELPEGVGRARERVLARARPGLVRGGHLRPGAAAGRRGRRGGPAVGRRVPAAHLRRHRRRDRAVLRASRARPRAPCSTCSARSGGQIAEFLEASRSADALRESEARKAAMLEAALDCGRDDRPSRARRGAQPRRVETLGYSREEAVGREMAELIVPPDLRDRPPQGAAAVRGHRRGRRCSASGWSYAP